MNMDDIKAEAVLAANEIEIDWEQLENPNYRADFENVLQRAVEFLPELEGLYSKLTAGKSVMSPEEDTPLEYADIEKYAGLIGEELYSGYVLAEIYHKYEMVNAVINADRNNPLDKPPTDQLDLDI
jgi:hypothetical protein